MKHKIHLIPAVTFFLILFYTVVIRARPLTPGVVSNSFAIAATFIIGLCFLLGPLSRLKPHKFVPCLKYRKALGLCGYLFAAIHAAGAIVLEFNTIASGENLYSIISAIFAFIIFTDDYNIHRKSHPENGLSKMEKIAENRLHSFLPCAYTFHNNREGRIRLATAGAGAFCICSSCSPD